MIKTKNFKEFCLYKLLDKDSNVLYIGKTTNFKVRMSQHFGKENFNSVLLFECNNDYERQIYDENFLYLINHHGHLPFECYESVRSVEKAILNNQYEMDILEIHLINKYKPIYNVEYKYENIKHLFNINEPKWLKTMDLEFLKDYFLITKCSLDLYNLIKDDDIMIDVIARNFSNDLSEDELMKLCDNTD